MLGCWGDHPKPKQSLMTHVMNEWPSNVEASKLSKLPLPGPDLRRSNMTWLAAHLLGDALVLRWEGVAHVAQGADPEAPLEVHLGVGVEDRPAGLAGDRLIGHHLQIQASRCLHEFDAWVLS